VGADVHQHVDHRIRGEVGSNKHLLEVQVNNGEERADFQLSEVGGAGEDADRKLETEDNSHHQEQRAGIGT